MTTCNREISEQEEQPHARASHREWMGLAVLALPALLLSMDLSVLYLAVPRLSAALRPSSIELLWITDIYGFLLAGCLMTMGTLGDRIGRRKLLMIGATAFGLASVVAAFSTTAATLITARAVMGIAAATQAPSSLALLTTMFKDRRQRTQAISIWATSLSAGGALGPIVGGVLLNSFWWGSVFLVAVPVLLLLVTTAPWFLPEYRNPEAARLDFPSVILSLLTLLLVIYGLKQLAQNGLGSLSTLAMVAGLILGVIFVRRQRVLGEPLIDLQLFRVPAFSVALVANTLGFFVVLGVFFFADQYLQLVLGLSPLWAGLWDVPPFAGFILGSLLVPLLLRSTRPVSVMAGGLALASIGFALLTRVSITSGLAPLVIGSVVFSLGMAPVFTLVTNTVLDSTAPQRAGAASGMAETSTELGGALGVAILGSIGTAVYRSQLAHALSAGILGNASGDTLGGTMATASHLKSALSPMVPNLAREAFTTSLQTVAGLSAAIVALLAVLVVVVLRRVQPEGETNSKL